MIIKETLLSGCFIIEPRIFKDDRGIFFESFNHIKFTEQTKLSINFLQDNQSISNKNTLRGLHMQAGEFSQAKLVRVVKGKVLDVVVDVRKGSKTFGKHYSCILSEKNNKQVFVPKGFLHGFLALEDHTIFAYKCDEYYNKSAETGVLYNDKSLNIDWQLVDDNIIISEKDKSLPTFEKFKLTL